MTETTGGRNAVWLDCDPGHDDAMAILLALFAPQQDDVLKAFRTSLPLAPALDVLGISSTHGNTTGRNTFINAARLLSAYGVAPGSVPLWRGSDEPLVRQPKIDKDIHGTDGLGGVEPLPSLQDEHFLEHIQKSNGGKWRDSETFESLALPASDILGTVTFQISLLRERVENGKEPISLVATGPLTNVAMLIKLCPPALMKSSIKQIVLMGGAAGTPGNRGLLAEWNILVDPEAASIVFDANLPVVMAGLNVTHQVIFTPNLQGNLSQSPLQRLISSAMTFFAGTYRDVFGFEDGPPVHDLLAVAWVLDESLFHSDPDSRAREPRRYQTIVDTREGISCGATVVDFYNQLPVDDAAGWGRGGRNAIVLEHVNIARLWALFFAAIAEAEKRVRCTSAEI